MRTDREAQGNTEGPWGWEIPMLFLEFLGRQRDPGKE